MIDILEVERLNLAGPDVDTWDTEAQFRACRIAVAGGWIVIVPDFSRRNAGCRADIRLRP